MKIKKIFSYLLALLVFTAPISANDKSMWDIARKQPFILSGMALGSIALGYDSSNSQTLKPSTGIAINFIANAMIGATILKDCKYRYSSNDIPFLLSGSLAQIGLFGLGYLIHFIKNPIESAINNNFSSLLRYYYGPKLKVSNLDLLSLIKLDRNHILEHLLETRSDRNYIDEILRNCNEFGYQSKKCIHTILPLIKDNKLDCCAIKNSWIKISNKEFIKVRRLQKTLDPAGLTSALQWALMDAINADDFASVKTIKPHVTLPKYLANHIKKYSPHKTLVRLRTILFNEKNKKKFWKSVVSLKAQTSTECEGIPDIIINVTKSYGTQCMLFTEAIKSAKKSPENYWETNALETKFANLKAAHEQVIKENPSDNYRTDPIVHHIYSYIGNNPFQNWGQYSDSIQKRKFLKK